MLCLAAPSKDRRSSIICYRDPDVAVKSALDWKSEALVESLPATHELGDLESSLTFLLESPGYSRRRFGPDHLEEHL